MNWTDRLQNLDRRVLYLLLAVMVAVPVFVHMRPPIPPSRETLGVYRAVEETPPGKLVMLHSTWDAGTIGECEAQSNALIEHLMSKGIPFVIWTSNPASPPFYNRQIEAAAKRHGRTYGEHWVDFGFKIPGGQLAFGVQSMARDFPGTMLADVRGTPAAQIPMLKGVRDATSFHLLISIGYNPTVEFLQFVQGVYGTNVAFAMAAIHSTTTYSYIDSRQIVGMLVGARGGAEYEMLVLGPRKGVDILVAQSFGHLLIILAVLVGNIGYLASRRRAESR